MVRLNLIGMFYGNYGINFKFNLFNLIYILIFIFEIRSHDYPFDSSLKKLENHQRINHFPGSGFITNKVSLATTDLLHIPKSFNLPRQKDEFLEFVSLKII